MLLFSIIKVLLLPFPGGMRPLKPRTDVDRRPWLDIPAQQVLLVALAASLLPAVAVAKPPPFGTSAG